MKEQITLLAQGRQPERPLVLQTMSEEISLSLAAGQNYRGELEIQEEGGRLIKGLAYSSHKRVRLQTSQFAASYAALEYEVDTTDLVPGDRIEGKFDLVTNGGERTISYVFEMTVPVGKTAYDKIRSIEAFAELARHDFDVALTIFENSSFLTLPFMEKPAFAALYHGLYGRGDRRGALEEFLVGCGAKEQLRLQVEEKPRYVPDPKEDVCDVIRIRRNTWGSVNIRVKSDVSFIELEKRVVTEESFEDHVCELRFIIHPAMLHAGTNFGRITLSTAYQKFVVEVTVTQPEGGVERRRQREYRRAYQQFYQSYVEAHAQEFQNPLLVNSMLTELARLRESYQTSDELELFHAEIYLRAGQKEKAGLLLADVKERVLARRREEIDTYCYYYYLRTLQSGAEEDRDQLRKILRFYYEGEHPSQTVFFLLLLTDDVRMENPLATMQEMKELYDRGCRSPFLYLALCRLIRKQPLLLTGLGEFELHGLLFGARRSMLSEDLAVRISRLSEEERGFRPAYYELLTILAEQYPDRSEPVSAVCRVLIQGDKKGPEYFEWFEKGIRLDVRLTRLYEYFLYSLPEEHEGELPREIYLYFSYTNTLDEHSRAVLYHNILSCFHPGDPMYDSFSGQMEEFAREQVFAGRMSRRLARIYDAMIPAEVVDEKLASRLGRLLHCVQISCDNPAWDQVVLSYEEWGREETAVLKNGKAIVALYSDHCRVLFQDVYGNRYAGGNYSQLQLMTAEELKERCWQLCPEDPYLLLHHCRRALDAHDDSEEALALYERTLVMPGLRDLFSRELTARIVAGTLSGSRHGDTGRLLRVETRHASREDALRMMEAFIEDDYCEKAFSMLEQYHFSRVKPSLLLKLCSRTCVDQLFVRNESLLRTCHTCLENQRSDDVILEYLCRYYNGSSAEMLEILMQAVTRHVEQYDLAERLLGQMLFTGWREGLDEVFAVYEKKGNVDELLLRAYLVQKCGDFFKRDVAADGHVFALVQQYVEAGRMPVIGRLALCRYLSYAKERTPEQTALCLDVIRYCSDRNVYFDFFNTFRQEAAYPAALKGRVIVSYRGRENELVRIRYRVLPDSQEYRTEILPHMYEGYCSKSFTVFYGERIQYEIYRERPEGLVRAAEGEVLPETGESRDRLGRLNRLLYGMDTMDEASLKKEMRAYGVTEMVLEHYFQKL